MESSMKRILVLGRTGAGKSWFCNRISKSSKFKESSNLESFTSRPQKEKFFIKIGNQQCPFEVIDTPGFGDNRLDHNKKSISKSAVKTTLEYIKNLEGGFHLGIVCIDANKFRVSKNEFKDFERIGQLLGQKVFEHTIVVLTMSNRISDVNERKRKIAEYKEKLPGMLQERGIKGVETVLDAGTHRWDEFQKEFEKILMGQVKFESELLNANPDTQEGLGKIAKDKGTSEFITDMLKEQIKELEEEIEEEKETFNDEQRLKGMEEDLKVLKGQLSEFQMAVIRGQVLGLLLQILSSSSDGSEEKQKKKETENERAKENEGSKPDSDGYSTDATFRSN